MFSKQFPNNSNHIPQNFKKRVYHLRDRSSLNLSINSLNLSEIPKEYPLPKDFPQPSCSNNNSIIIVDTTKNEVISVIDDGTVFEQSVPPQNYTPKYEVFSVADDSTFSGKSEPQPQKPEQNEQKPSTSVIESKETVSNEDKKDEVVNISEDKKDETVNSLEDRKDETIKATDENDDDDVQFIPQKVEIINICDESEMPSPKKQSEDMDSSSDEEEEEEEDDEDTEGEEELEEGELGETKLATPNQSMQSKSVILLEEDSESIVEISDDDDDDCWDKKKIPEFLSLKVNKPAMHFKQNPEKPKPKKSKATVKRQLIIDGSNVAFAHGRDSCFSVKGLTIAAKYFEDRGHEIFIVIPQFRRQKSKTTDSDEIEKLFKDGKMYFSPSKNLPGQSSSSYDDRFILQMAQQMDAAVLSNDNYRDLIAESKDFEQIIKTRVIPYTFCKDLFMVPTDPYGRWGPSLQDILEVPPKQTNT
ncbi:hypothetical protein ACFFRR_007924 [Megaselia abdita]